MNKIEPKYELFFIHVFVIASDQDQYTMEMSACYKKLKPRGIIN